MHTTQMLSVLSYALPSPKPVVFSSGLYSTMPSAVYSDLLASVRSQGASVIDAPTMLTKRGFEDICDEHDVDRLPLITHSSFDARILDSRRIERALLLDPVALPSLGVSGIVAPTISPRAPTCAIYSKLYGSFVKPAFRPNLQGADEIQLQFGGHSDLLDGMWPWVASMIGIASDTSDGVQQYKQFLSVYLKEWVVSPRGELAQRTSEG
jgi:hypothetical protein